MYFFQNILGVFSKISNFIISEDIIMFSSINYIIISETNRVFLSTLREHCSFIFWFT